MAKEKRHRVQLQTFERQRLMMVGEGIMTLLAVTIALRIWAWVGELEFNPEFLLSQAYWFILLPTLWFLLASANDLYDPRVVSSLQISLARLVLVTLQLWAVYLVIFFLSEPMQLPRLFVLYYGIASLLALAGWRMAYWWLLGGSRFTRRVFIMGSDWTAQTMINALSEYAPHAYDIVGLIGEGLDPGEKYAGLPILGGSADLVALAHKHEVTEVILNTTQSLSGDVLRHLMEGYEAGLTLTPMPLLYERITGRVPVEHVNQNWVVVFPIGGPSVFDMYPLFKRIMDIVLALIGLAIFLMMLPFIALAIKLDSSGPIFYMQERTGKAGKPFRVIKLRTMVQDAEKRSGPLWAAKGDPRITTVGRFLRKSRLDEVPQLINVLRGEMSMVGPRPERPKFVEMLSEEIPFYNTRHVIQPGVTGWAQVKYRYGSSTYDSMVKLQYDLYYIRHRSLMLDILILIRTVRKMLLFQGT